MSGPRFESADAFLTSLTHELVQRGTKSAKIDSFRRAAAGNPEWTLLAETAIDLRDSYERHRQAGKHGDTWQGSLSSGGVARASGGIVAIARRAKPIGAFFGGVAVMCLVSVGWHAYKLPGTAMASNDSIARTLEVADRSVTPTAPAQTRILGGDYSPIGHVSNMTPITREKWAAVKHMFDARIEERGSFDSALVVQALMAGPANPSDAMLESPVPPMLTAAEAP